MLMMRTLRILFLFVVSALGSACVRGLPQKTLYDFVQNNSDLLKENGINIAHYALPNGNVLVDGQEIAPISFKTLFHEATAMRFDSVDFANTVMDTYRDGGAFQLNGMDHFRGGYILSKDSFFLFSRKSAESRLLAYHQPYLESESVGALRDIFHKITRTLQSQYPGVTSRHPKRVVVLTGPYGGGHESAAGAIKESLGPEFSVKLLDVCSFEPKGLFYKILGADMKNCEVYKKIQLREGNPSKAQILSFLGETLRHYELTDMWLNVFKAIRKEKPSLIISTIHHISQATWIAMMAQVPLRIVVTDYDSPHAQSPLINFYDASEVRLWLPSKSPIQFTAVEAYIDKEPRAGGFGRTQLIFDRVIQGRERLDAVKEDLEIFEFQPFPLFSGFLKKEPLSLQRTRLGLPAETDKKTLALMYGSGAGGPAPIEALKSLLQALDLVDGAFEVLFLTTSNPQLQSEARRIVEERGERLVHFKGQSLESQMPHGQKTVVVLFDTLDRETMMPAVYGVSSMVLTKPGGATAAELLETRRFLVPVFPIFPWEMGNLTFLKEVGLAPQDVATERGALSVSELAEIIQKQLRQPRRLRDLPESFSPSDFRARVRAITRKSAQ
jgi:UDP-N-acetylglucosamine:LPS N-acetylglucosamine transferase